MRSNRANVSQWVDDWVADGFVFVSFAAIVLLSPSKSRIHYVTITANTHVSFLFITSGSPVVDIVGDLRNSDGYAFQIFIRSVRFEDSRKKQKGCLNLSTGRFGFGEVEAGKEKEFRNSRSWKRT